MKTFRKIGLTVIAVLACMCATSCGDDDDDDESGNSNGSVSATVDGSAFKLSNVYWWIDNDNHDMHIEFYSYNPTDPSSFPGYANIMTIDYEVPANVNSLQATTLESGQYHIYLVQNITMSDGGWQGETMYNSTSNSQCIITGSGSNFTIKIDHATVSDESETKTVKLNFSGKISELPEYLRGDD